MPVLATLAALAGSGLFACYSDARAGEPAVPTYEDTAQPVAERDPFDPYAAPSNGQPPSPSPFDAQGAQGNAVPLQPPPAYATPAPDVATPPPAGVDPSYGSGYGAAYDAAYDSVDETDPAAYATFAPALAPYGTWRDDATYGEVWVPDPSYVGIDFTPYVTGGHWAYTDAGYYWASDWSWGWAPFHYGRWTFIVGFGWGWVPGARYAPAWVDWRYGDGYVGWAPRPPTWGWRHGRAIVVRDVGAPPSSRWAFCRGADLFSPRTRNVIAAPPVRDRLFTRTRSYATPAVATSSAGAPGRARVFHGPPPSVAGIPATAVRSAAITVPTKVRPDRVAWRPTESSRIAPPPRGGGPQPNAQPLPRPNAQPQPLPRPNAQPLPRPNAQPQPLPRPNAQPLPRDPLPRPNAQPLPRDPLPRITPQPPARDVAPPPAPVRPAPTPAPTTVPSPPATRRIAPRPTPISPPAQPVRPVPRGVRPRSLTR
jgi:hypothetical protein